MKLTLSQLRSVTFGAASVTEEADGIHFFRFTEAQQEIYRNASAEFYKKTFATSNVRLEFFTDSKHLSIEVLFEKASGRLFSFADIRCNGNTVAHIGSRDASDGLYGNTLDLGDGEKQICVYLPYGSKAVLRALTLDDGASLIPVKKDRRMLIFGDSITQGHDATYPSHSYSSLLADRLQADARNKGIGGELFFPPLLSVSEGDFNPDLITVAYGTNDWSKAKVEGEVEERMRAFYSRLSALYPNAKIFALTPIWRKDEQTQKPTGPFSDMEPMMRRTVKDLPNVTVISGYDLVPHDPTYYYDLYLHPNDAGFAFYAERLVSAICEYLK